jgi:DNA-binding NarL/FixJ family response regulator
VVGEAEDARQAFAAVESLRPDLILCDITMPGKSGLEYIRDIRARDPKLMVLVMSMHDESIYAERALRAGARGYIMKSEGGKKLLLAMRQVLQGEIYVSKKISVDLLNVLAGRRSPDRDSTLSALTDREFEVFQLIGSGLSTREIAKSLCISGKTVETHRLHLREKLNLKAHSALTAYAVRWAASNQLV